MTIPPGATIGILGGGQLGRMIVMAAARLGYRCHVYCPDRDAPATHVAAATIAPYDDGAALAAFARAVDVVTLEFENVPLAAIETVAATTPCRPGAAALAVAQDRLREKKFMADAGVPVTRHAAVDSPAALDAAVATVGLPALLKTNRLGYDGRGQVRLDTAADAASAWAAIEGQPAILEAYVPFEREVSTIVARAVDGAVAAYVPVENEHAEGILRRTTAPASITPAVAERARSYATRLAEALGVVGLLAIEFFVTVDGTVLANELAPRPHNSGHWTLDACAVSQFEQLVRAICGLPLGDPDRHADATMENLIGDAVDAWPALLAEPGAHLHLYGKAPRPGRKMGHVTRLTPRAY